MHGEDPKFHDNDRGMMMAMMLEEMMTEMKRRMS
jgi:hypothetical protein